jgi:hypothetical protein
MADVVRWAVDATGKVNDCISVSRVARFLASASCIGSTRVDLKPYTAAVLADAFGGDMTARAAGGGAPRSDPEWSAVRQLFAVARSGAFRTDTARSENAS